MRATRSMSVLMVTLIACVPLHALCADTAPTPTPAPAHPPVAAPTTTFVKGMGQSVAAGELARLSGGTEVTNSMTLNGTVSNNTDENLTTGMNMIGGNSFDGSAGLPSVIQNTGNNVLIQNATIINVQFKQ
jgi:hypothetical protein